MSHSDDKYENKSSNEDIYSSGGETQDSKTLKEEPATKDNCFTRFSRKYYMIVAIGAGLVFGT